MTENEGKETVASLDDIHADNLRIIAALNKILHNKGFPPV